MVRSRHSGCQQVRQDTDHGWWQVVCPTAFCTYTYSFLSIQHILGTIHISETRATISKIRNSSPNTVCSVLSTSSDQGLWCTRPEAGELLQLTYQTHKAQVIFTIKRVKQYIQVEHILWSELQRHGQDVNRAGYDQHCGTPPKPSSIPPDISLFRLNLHQLATACLMIALKYLK